MTDRAFVELFNGGIVRVGAGKPPEPYEYSVTFALEGEYAVVKGFWHKHITKSDFELIGHKINEATGKLVAYDRAPNRRFVQIHPSLTGGKIIMAIHKSKTSIPSPTDAVKDNKKIDMNVLRVDSAQAAKMFETGKETMLNVERVVLADGSVIDMFHHIATKSLKV